MTIRIMDEATKKAFQGLLPFAPGAYITTGLDCFDHIPEEFRPLFRVRDFTAEQYHATRAKMSGDQEVPHDFMVKTLQEGVLGPWENLPDSQFNEIPFSTEAIATLPHRWVAAFFWTGYWLCYPNKLEREVLGSSPLPTSDTSSNPAQGADAAQA